MTTKQQPIVARQDGGGVPGGGPRGGPRRAARPCVKQSATKHRKGEAPAPAGPEPAVPGAVPAGEGRRSGRVRARATDRSRRDTLACELGRKGSGLAGGCEAAAVRDRAKGAIAAMTQLRAATAVASAASGGRPSRLGEGDTPQRLVANLSSGPHPLRGSRSGCEQCRQLLLFTSPEPTRCRRHRPPCNQLGAGSS